MTNRLALYPGTFDPVTFGHLDILERALALFDNVTVLVATGSERQLFTADERATLLREATDALDGCRVEIFGGLLVDEIDKREPAAVVRGLRSAADYEHEWSLAGVNTMLAPDSEYVYLLAKRELAPVSSTLVRDVARHGGATGNFVPAGVAKALAAAFTTR